MLTAVKNQIKVTFLSIKYAVLREMLNKVSFISNIIFMILNNSCMIVQWIVLFSLKSDIGGYSFKQILLLWGLAASDMVYLVSSLKDPLIYLIQLIVEN